MRIPSSEIPQADVLDDVVRVAEAVQKGARSFQDLAQYIGKVGRQGRYYRLAAEILGLVVNYRNYAELTPFGEGLINASPQDQKSMLLEAVLNAALFQRMVPFFEMHAEGVTREELQEFMVEVTEPVGPTMMPRRASTVISWLETLHVLRPEQGRYRLTYEMLENAPLVEFPLTEPLLPRSSDLKEYETVEERSTSAASAIEVMRDQAKVERASQAHNDLVNLVAARLRTANVLPRCNQLIDLAARANERPHIFEMKSMTPDNARSQIRFGLSQLYEYRYLQNLSEATLILVVEIPLPEEILWMQHYLEEDRQVRLVWDGNNELYASPETQEELPFLW